MFKKLLLFSIVFLLVFSISVEPASAGWFEDTINWFKEILGFSQEEAEIKAMELMKDNSALYIEKAYVSSEVRNGINYDKYDGVIHTGNIPYFVNESNKLIPRSEAKSLKDLYWNGELLFACDVKDDGINLMDCVEFNATSRTYKLQRDSLALTDVPIK